MSLYEIGFLTLWRYRYLTKNINLQKNTENVQFVNSFLFRFYHLIFYFFYFCSCIFLYILFYGTYCERKWDTCLHRRGNHGDDGDEDGGDDVDDGEDQVHLHTYPVHHQQQQKTTDPCRIRNQEPKKFITDQDPDRTLIRIRIQTEH